MDLSIVIVSYNTKELLLECLNSVRLATRKINTEVFVVDNDSKDGSPEMVAKDFKEVKLFANKQNLGFSKANNQALKKARGKYILVLNPDTQVLKDTLVKMIDFMNKNPDVAVSSCRVELANGSLDRDCRRHYPTPWRAFTHFSGLSQKFKGSKIFDQYYMGYLSEKKEHEVDACVGAFMMVRKKAMDVVGLFDEDFFFYGEDLDWCFRFRQEGYKIVFTPITKIIHHKGAASGMKQSSKDVTKASKESKKRALFESVHSMEIFYKKHYVEKYPFYINWPVILSLKALERIRVASA
mgnify:CR=1 FL=1